MPDDIELTPTQQQLMAFLDQLATEPLTNEMLSQGYELLDLAADECRDLQQSIVTQQQRGGQQ